MEKNQLLSELYSLRAGLSLVEGERKKLEKCENVVKNIDKTIKENNENIESNKGTIQSCNLGISNCNRRISETVPIKREGCFDYALGGSIIGAILGAVGVIVWYVVGKIEPKWELIVGAGVGAVIGLIIGLLIHNNKNVKPEKNRVDGIKEGINKEINQASGLIKNLEKKNNELIEANKSKGEERKTAVQNYNSEAEVTVPVIRTMYKALLETYSPTLDPRDWENLDLIIYYITTGRADSLKEALQQVDMQKRAETLVQAIGEASNAICKSIEVNIGALREEMKSCFSRLSAQLRNQHASQMKTLSSISSGISSMSSEVNQRLSALNTSASMQTALLSQINVSSKKLADDAHYIYEHGATILR